MDCLVTKLNATVNNDELCKIGEMNIFTETLSDDFNAATSGKIAFRPVSGNTITVDTIGGWFVTDVADYDTAAQHKTHIEISTSNADTTLYFKNGDYLIKIGNKYDLFKMAMDSGTGKKIFRLNYDDLAYISSFNTCILTKSEVVGNIKNTPVTIGTLNVARTSISGNLNFLKNSNNNSNNYNNINLGNMPNLTGNLQDFDGFVPNNLASLAITGCTGISGDIKYLGGFNKLTALNLIGCSNIGGTLEEFAAKMVSSATGGGSRTSGTLNISLQSSGVTYGGSVPTSAKTVRFGSSMVSPTPEETTQGYQVA